MHIKTKSIKDKGFTIVELLVVIVVIGILAAITIVSYGNVTNRANTSAGASDAGSFVTKAATFSAELAVPTPTTYGSITNAANTKLYAGSSYVFTTASGNKLMSAYRPAGIANDALDFQLCGTNSAAAATTYATINVPTGFKIGYWDYTAGSENNTLYHGTVAGSWTNGYNITCYKVGIAEAVIAVTKAMYAETGAYPLTATGGATSIMGNAVTGATLPAGLNVVGTATNPTTLNGTTNLRYECGSAVAATAPCNNTGGRISFWDYSLGTPAVATITYGTSVNFYTPGS